jgi:hypothetical protein
MVDQEQYLDAMLTKFEIQKAKYKDKKMSRADDNHIRLVNDKDIMINVNEI